MAATAATCLSPMEVFHAIGWRVDELSAPQRSVAIFQLARPRTPQPSAGGGKPSEQRATKTTRSFKPRTVVAPASQPVVATTVATDVAEPSFESTETASAIGHATGTGGGRAAGPGIGNAPGLQGGPEPTMDPAGRARASFGQRHCGARHGWLATNPHEFHRGHCIHLAGA